QGRPHPSPHYEQIDENELLYGEGISSSVTEPSTTIIQTHLEMLASHLDQQIESVKKDVSKLRKSVLSEIQNVKNDLSSMSLTQVSKASPSSLPISHHSPRVLLPPRSHFRTPNSLDRVTPRDRSRSPIAQRVTPSKPLHVTQTIKCSFCSSICYYTRQCTIIKSVASRVSLMQPGQCLRCFRLMNSAHSATCELDPCKRGCVDEKLKAIGEYHPKCLRNALPSGWTRERIPINTRSMMEKLVNGVAYFGREVAILDNSPFRAVLRKKEEVCELRRIMKRVADGGRIPSPPATTTPICVLQET
ncbi:hypothetical protein PMAYCL1PPCAC_23913, partial [Pristionchus mayeri]